MEFSVVTTLTALPAQCRTCGGAGKEWYLDTGYSEEFYGAVVFCCDCIAHIANVCGFITPAEAKKLGDQVTEAERALFEAKLELDGLREIKNGILKLGLAGGADTSDSALPVRQAGNSEGSQGGAGSVGDRAGTVAEPGDDEQLGGVHSDYVSDGDSGFSIFG